jgi:SAM-dependent methyltransferase
MSRRTESIDRAYFDTLYAADPDPWRFAPRAYERDKYAASLAALPDPAYGSVLEIGCSIGVFTRQLAGRSRHVLALDVADAALAQARQNCPLDHVTFENRRVPEEWPEGIFDLMVFSEVLYYLDREALADVARRVPPALSKSGVILLVHYLGETDYPLSGHEAADIFVKLLNFPTLAQTITESYRIDVLKT